MTLGAFKAFNNSRMGLMRMLFHHLTISPQGGYSQERNSWFLPHRTSSRLNKVFCQKCKEETGKINRQREVEDARAHSAQPYASIGFLGIYGT